MVRTKEEQKQELRSRIQESIDKARDDQKRELFKRRVELARLGVDKFGSAKAAESVGAFESYIRLVEEMKKVKEGGLTPSHFDKKLDLPEMLLISGMYWDLAKVYDRAVPSKNSIAKMNLCLEKFVIFSKKMPYELICAETLRKYVYNDKATHKDAFLKHYKKLTDGRCFIASAVYEHLHRDTFDTLRWYRDFRLNRSFLGKGIIHSYYAVGPLLANWVERWPHFLKRALARMLDRFARRAGKSNRVSEAMSLSSKDES